MNIGSKVSFSFKDATGARRATELVLSSNMIGEGELSDAAVVERLTLNLRRMPTTALKQNGYILAVRNLLAQHPDATDINLAESRKQQSNGGNGDGSGAGGIIILAFVAVIVAIILFPLLVMLGMRGKLFLKGFYAKCEGDAYKKFAKKYTFGGIALYVVTIAMFVVDMIFQLNMLAGPAFGLLFVGGVAYFVISLIIVKKKYLGDEKPANFMDALKSGFKKKEKKQ